MNITGEQYAASKYNEYVVKAESTLFDFLMHELHGISRNKVKDILQGHGSSVDKKVVTQYDYRVKPGMGEEVCKQRRKTE